MVIMGAMGRTETDAEGMAEAGTINTAETGVKDAVGICAVGTAGVATADTLTFAASPGPLKGSANKRKGHTNKRGRVNLAQKKKKKKRGGRKESTYP